MLQGEVWGIIIISYAIGGAIGYYLRKEWEKDHYDSD